MSDTQKIVINRSTEEMNGDVGVNVPAEPLPETPATPPPENTTGKPSWLPDKFKSPEELAKAYKELEKRVGTKIPETPTPLSEVSLEPFYKEFQDTGTVSEESIQKITALGYPESFVRSYIQGQQSLMESQNASIMSRVGGREAYTQMTEWASENLSSEEIDSFNDTIASGNTHTINLAIDGLKSRWHSSTGIPGKTPLVRGDATTSSSSGAFRSIAEIVAAMKDPRYDKDPAYRKDVESRVSISNVLGVSN